MPGSPSKTLFHHFMPSNFSKVICTILLSNSVHMQSSGLTLECILPFRISGSPLSPTLSFSPPMSQITSLALTPGRTGTYTSRALSVWVHVYLSVFPPLPGGGGSLLSSSSSSFAAFTSSPSLSSSCLASPFSALICSASSSVTSSIFGCSASFFFLSSCSFAYSSSSFRLFSSALRFRSSSARRFFSWASLRRFCPPFQCFW
mmetsp:Transcript_88377/g.248981  ORF Transcript_88377/g.248981 Transcript_88377/m.248981 type:complete len:203 (-) Transcript_88377:236-844(-)